MFLVLRMFFSSSFCSIRSPYLRSRECPLLWDILLSFLWAYLDGSQRCNPPFLANGFEADTSRFAGKAPGGKIIIVCSRGACDAA